MDSLRFDLSKKAGKFKILNAVNGGPCQKKHTTSKIRSNFDTYKAARIPYSRNHDANLYSFYGGPYSHDITKIFPNFDADPYDPASYDFACTDECVELTLKAGTKTFYRLGETIEHLVKPHAANPPKDFKKWAVICEHIIRHYTEGWADGFEYDMPYWEIWNEPDLKEETPDHRPSWTGTRSQYFDLYEITAKHLKKCFPHLKIGGPALASRIFWAEDFLYEMEKREAPLDFFSWHCYCGTVEKMLKKAETFSELLKKYHFEHTESILNEWNYMRNWTDAHVYSLKSIHNEKGASFMMACMCAGQSVDIDMMMYYDLMPSIWNGAYDFYSHEPIKGYYPLYWYGMFYDRKHEIKAENSIENIYSLCGVDDNDKVLAVLAYFNDDETLPNQKVSLDLGREGKYEVYLVDDEHDGELVAVTDTLEFDMKLYSVILIKEIEE